MVPDLTLGWNLHHGSSGNRNTNLQTDNKRGLKIFALHMKPKDLRIMTVIPMKQQPIPKAAGALVDII